MKRRWLGLVLILALMLTGGFAAHAEEITVQAALGGGMFYTAAAADRYYLGDMENHLIYAISADGTTESYPAVTALEERATYKRYRSLYALAGECDALYGVMMTVEETPDAARFTGAELYRLGCASGADEYICALDLSAVIDMDAETPDAPVCADALMCSGRLTLLFARDDFTSTPAKPICCDTATGSCEAVELSDAESLLNDADGVLYYARRSQSALEIVARQMDGGAERLLQTIDAVNDVSNPTMDRASGAVYYRQGGQIFGMRAIGDAPRPVGGCALRAPSGLNYFNGTLCAYDMDAAALIPVDWNYSVEARSLSVLGDCRQLADYASAHPELALEMRDFTDACEIVDAVLTQTATPDVFVVDTNSEIYGALRARGYLLPIERAALTNYADRLHPDIRSAVSIDDTLCAVPISLAPQNRMGINAALWDALGLGKRPADWAEMAAFLRSWPDIAREHPEVSLLGTRDPDSLHSSFLNRLLLDYEDYRSLQPEPMDYDTERLRQLVEEIEFVDYAALAYPDAADPENVLFSMIFISTVKRAEPRYEALPLAVVPDGEAAMRANVSVLAINPYAENREAALDFMEYAVQNLSDEARIELMPDENAPVGLESYAADVSGLEAQGAELDAAIASAQPTDAVLLQAQRDDISARLAELKANPYEISAEDIALYRSATARIHVMNDGGMSATEKSELDQLRMRLCMREIELDEFIREMDRRLAMRAAEGE